MMRALTLWQYWASLMAEGFKTIETRSWATKYRGELAITASARRPEPYPTYPTAGGPGEVGSSLCPFAVLLGPIEDLPLGAVLCVVRLDTCLPAFDALTVAIACQETTFGDYSAGRFGWITSNVRKLATPVPCKGRQGLWTLPPDVEEKVRAQL